MTNSPEPEKSSAPEQSPASEKSSGADWREFAEPPAREAEEQPKRAQRRLSRTEAAARRRAKQRRRTIAVLVAVVALVSAGAVFALPVVGDTVRSVLHLGGKDYDKSDATGEEVEVVIPEGATGAEIGAVLHEADVIASARAFTDVAARNPQAEKIQPGTYLLPERIPAATALSLLLDPTSRQELIISIPEGFTITQVIDRVAAATNTPNEDVAAIAQDAAALGLPGEAGGLAEGWFAPATYTFQPGDQPAQILPVMVEHTVTRLERLELPREDWQRVLIEASIIEREVAQPDYYGKVARVLENRLADTEHTGGKLQMDSTVLYGVGKSGGIPTRSDLDSDNPYNTYMHAGLPPTPIGSPGEAAIRAAMAPEEGPWLYFVTVNLDSGETKFSATIDEHNAYVREFRAWMNANGQ